MWLLNQINLFTVNNCIAYGGWVPTSTGNQPVAGNPDKPAMRPHTLGVTASVTLNDSGEWIDASEKKNQTNKQTNKQTNREPGWAQRSHHEVEIPKERGRDNNNNKATALAGGCNENNAKQHIHSSNCSSSR